MASQLIKKSDCEFKNHRIVCDGAVVGIGHSVRRQLESLERHYQECMYLAKQPDYAPLPSLEGFAFESAVEDELPHIALPATPTIDKREAEAKAYVDELDSVDEAKDVNRLIDRYAKLVRWVEADEFIEEFDEDYLDLKYLGNPLELTLDKLIDVFEAMVCGGLYQRIESEPVPIGPVSSWAAYAANQNAEFRRLADIDGEGF